MPDWLKAWLREEARAWGFAVALILTWALLHIV